MRADSHPCGQTPTLWAGLPPLRDLPVSHGPRQSCRTGAREFAAHGARESAAHGARQSLPRARHATPRPGPSPCPRSNVRAHRSSSAVGGWLAYPAPPPPLGAPSPFPPRAVASARPAAPKCPLMGWLPPAGLRLRLRYKVAILSLLGAGLLGPLRVPAARCPAPGRDGRPCGRPAARSAAPPPSASPTRRPLGLRPRTPLRGLCPPRPRGATSAPRWLIEHDASSSARQAAAATGHGSARQAHDITPAHPRRCPRGPHRRSQPG